MAVYCARRNVYQDGGGPGTAEMACAFMLRASVERPRDDRDSSARRGSASGPTSDSRRPSVGSALEVPGLLPSGLRATSGRPPCATTNGQPTSLGIDQSDAAADLRP